MGTSRPCQAHTSWSWHIQEKTFISSKVGRGVRARNGVTDVTTESTQPSPLARKGAATQSKLMSSSSSFLSFPSPSCSGLALLCIALANASTSKTHLKVWGDLSRPWPGTADQRGQEASSSPRPGAARTVGPCFANRRACFLMRRADEQVLTALVGSLHGLSRKAKLAHEGAQLPRGQGGAEHAQGLRGRARTPKCAFCSHSDSYSAGTPGDRH